MRVDNVDPTLTLDISGAISFAGGKAFTGIKGIEQSHDASATDPGSDDLILTWSFGQSTTYFNDGLSADLFPSSEGIFPFSAGDNATVTFAVAGVHTISVVVGDDDGGIDSDSLSKLVSATRTALRPSDSGGTSSRARAISTSTIRH